MAYISFKPTDYFNTKLYTGNSSTQSITGVGFQPDWVWFKNRAQAYDHQAFDAVRGVTKRISPNTTSAESTESASLTSFDSDGFSVGNYNPINESPNGIVSWNWKANGSGSANTDGTISSTVSANTTAGFSIVKYTGTGSAATVGHGLGVTPGMIIVRPYTLVQYTSVFHQVTGTSYYGYLNVSDAFINSPSNVWDSTMSSTVFGVGGGVATNISGETHIAYCFAPVQGYSKFSSYTGNGNANGPFVYTGFRPAFIMMKESSASGQGWCIKTSASNSHTGNQNNYFLNAANSNAEHTSDTTFGVDFLSNGFKIRSTDGIMNGSGDTFIYMAFAEFPIVGSNDTPGVAR